MFRSSESTWKKATHTPYINSSKIMGATDLPMVEERCLIQRNSQRCDDDQFKQKTEQKWNHTSEQYSHYQCLHYLKNPRHLINMLTRRFKCNLNNINTQPWWKKPKATQISISHIYTPRNNFHHIHSFALQVFKIGSYSIGIPEKNMTMPTSIHIALNHKITSTVINRDYYPMALQYIAYAHMLRNWKIFPKLPIFLWSKTNLKNSVIMEY